MTTLEAFHERSRRASAILKSVVVCVISSLLQQNGAGQTFYGFSPHVYSNMYVGNIRLSGTVVDAESNSIPGVSLLVTVADYPEPPLDHLHRIQQVLTNCAFSLSYTNIHSVSLYFQKSGFCPADRTYPIGGGMPLTNGQTRTVVCSDIQVVLKPQGQLTQLIDYREFITFSGSGKAVAMDVGRKKDHALIDVANIASLNLAPATTFWLTAQTNEHGVIMTDSNGLPQDVYLHVADTNGGFIQFTPSGNKDVNATPSSPYIEMGQAPESGYVSVLPAPTGDEDRFFYFKVANTFGKGQIPAVSFTLNGQIQAQIQLRLQTNGSRNVATDD